MDLNPGSDESSPSIERNEATRDLLLRAAKSVFAKCGYEGATVKQIATQAGVNVSLVSYHFNGKEGLYRTCFEEVGRQRLAATERVLKTPLSAEDFRVRLQLFTEEFFLWNLAEADVCVILHRECVGEMPLTKDIFRDTFLKSFQIFSDFFESARAAGILRKELNSLLTAGFFYGSLIHVVRTQTLVKETFGFSLEDKDYRDQIIEQAIYNLMHGTIDSTARGQHP